MFQKILSCHRIRLILYTIQRRTDECCLGLCCVSSWSYYDLERGIPWQIGFILSLFLIIWCLPVHKNHRYVQGWNPTTTTYFPERHNNNNNNNDNIEKPNKKLEEKGKEVVVA